MDSLYVEYCDPYDGKFENFWMKLEHLGRYFYACDLISKNDTVLDVACANGYGSCILAHAAKSVVGVDRNKKYIAEAAIKTKAKNVEYGLIDLEKENIPAKKFDFAICFETLEHLSDYKNAVKFLADSLKEGGTLVVSFPNIRFEKLDENGNNKDIYHLNLIGKENIIKEFQKYFVLEEELGQTIANIALNNEIVLLEAGEITKKQLKDKYEFLYSLPSLNYFSKVLAYPNKFDIDGSYSYILKLRKI